MQCFLFHLMPYACLDLDYDKQYDSSWVVYPNSNFDPKMGHYLYNTYLDELEMGEELGFDGVCVNEHHQNAYGLMPSPIVPASALARRRMRSSKRRPDSPAAGRMRAASSCKAFSAAATSAAAASS